MWKSITITFCFAVLGTFWGFHFYHQIKYPAPNKLERSGGMIHHPTYGDYPEEVPYEDGMSLMPGQTAVGKIQFKMEKVK